MLKTAVTYFVTDHKTGSNRQAMTEIVDCIGEQI